MMTTINQQEAGCFATHAALKGWTTAEALEHLGRTTWPDSRADLAFGRRRHAPTIRRLAARLVAGLDARQAAAEAHRAAEARDRQTWASLPASDRAAISAATVAAHGKASNKSARDLAQRHGLTDACRDIAALRALMGA